MLHIQLVDEENAVYYIQQYMRAGRHQEWESLTTSLRAIPVIALDPDRVDQLLHFLIAAEFGRYISQALSVWGTEPAEDLANVATLKAKIDIVNVIRQRLPKLASHAEGFV